MEICQCCLKFIFKMIQNADHFFSYNVGKGSMGLGARENLSSVFANNQGAESTHGGNDIFFISWEHNALYCMLCTFLVFPRKMRQAKTIKDNKENIA